MERLFQQSRKHRRACTKDVAMINESFNQHALKESGNGFCDKTCTHLTPLWEASISSQFSNTIQGKGSFPHPIKGGKKCSRDMGLTVFLYSKKSYACSVGHICPPLALFNPEPFQKTNHSTDMGKLFSCLPISILPFILRTILIIKNPKPSLPSSYPGLYEQVWQ